jgi:hypothetical protein
MGEFSNRLAEMVSLTGPVIDDQLKVVNSDGATDRIAQTLYKFNSSSRCGMLKYNLQRWESLVELLELWQEPFLGIHDTDITFGIRWDFTMQVEDHPFFLHSLEDWVINFIVFNATIAVGGYASRI